MWLRLLFVSAFLLLELIIVGPLVLGAALIALLVLAARLTSTLISFLCVALDRPAMTRSQADNASRIAAIVALLLAIGALLAWPLFRSGEFVVAGDRSKTTHEKQVVTKPDGKATETVKDTEETPGRTSLFDRALGEDEAALLLRLAAIALFTFFAAALVQRLLLANYGITLGPIGLPPLDAQAVQAAVERVAGAVPDVAVALPAGIPLTPQESPLLRDVEDPRMQFLALRAELEARLRRLAVARGVRATGPLKKVVDALRDDGAFDDTAASALKKLLEMGDRAAQGAEVEDDVLEAVESESVQRLLFNLGQLATIAALQGPAPSAGPGAQPFIDDLMRRSAKDDLGRPLVKRFEAPNGKHVWMIVDAAGDKLQGWENVGAVPSGTARREDGSSLMGLVPLHGGILPIPLDEDGNPAVSVEAEVYPGEEILYGTEAGPPDWTVRVPE